MKFIADVMLGRLAKQLRLLGFDVLYERTFGDEEIIHLSLVQQRVILTRDAALVRRPLASNHCYLRSEKTAEQLKQVLANFSLSDSATPLTRCSLCNEPLIPIPKQNAQDSVPPFIYEQTKRFLRCNRCNKIYWNGSHIQRMHFLRRKGC